MTTPVQKTPVQTQKLYTQQAPAVPANPPEGEKVAQGHIIADSAVLGEVLAGAKSATLEGGQETLKTATDSKEKSGHVGEFDNEAKKLDIGG